jgi:CCR4-NOT transcriptional complex subunit CAF120
MESSTPSLNTTANQQGQLQFPSLEPQRRQHPNQSPDMSKHTRTTSFFAAFRSNKQQNSERGTHERTVSLGSIPKSTAGASAPGGAVQTAGSMGVQRQQTQQQQLSPRVSPAVPTTTMLQQQQSAAAAYQQPLPPTPPAPDVGTNTGRPNTTAPVATPSSSTPASPQPVNKPQSAAPGQTPPLHPEIRSVVGLTVAHAHKIYFSGPLVRRIERQADGQRPHKDEGWTEVWAQLGGTTLSIWDMKEVQEASRQGKEVPPAYINVTDAVCVFAIRS